VRELLDAGALDEELRRQGDASFLRQQS
jgi:hypothetical protein